MNRECRNLPRNVDYYHRWRTHLALMKDAAGAQTRASCHPLSPCTPECGGGLRDADEGALLGGGGRQSTRGEYVGRDRVEQRPRRRDRWIQSLYTVPEHRGRGLVATILAHLVQAATMAADEDDEELNGAAVFRPRGDLPCV